MTTMIERVARAIGGEESGAPVDEPGERWRNWEPAARAAIAAMREGLPKLQDETWFECIATECESAGTSDGTWANLKALAEWADQFNAALEEKP
ncbi:hypothetical protein ACXIUS_19550 [Bosea thiooxidans]